MRARRPGGFRRLKIAPAEREAILGSPHLGNNPDLLRLLAYVGGMAPSPGRKQAIGEDPDFWSDRNPRRKALLWAEYLAIKAKEEKAA